MRRHRLRFGGGDSASLGEGCELGVDDTVGDTALVKVLPDSDSEPKAATR